MNLIEFQEHLNAVFWQTERRYLQAVILPRITTMAIEGANLGLDRLSAVGIMFDNAQAHAAAAQWAREFTDSFLRDEFNITTQKSVGEIIANWVETPGATMADLNRMLKPILDDNMTRANAFAITESTRAFTRGELATYTEAGLPRAVIAPPDGDVNCRCWTAPVRLPNDDWVILWQTVRDSKVRTEPKETPWGEVAGHKALHNVVISEGPYLGMTLNDARVLAQELGNG